MKAEFFNPAASVKDRLALNIIEEGERSGALKPGQTVVEATSGNTGIGLAMVCAQKGYPLVVTMADSFSIERRKLMRMLGAKVVLTPRAQKGIGMYKKAVELAEANGWFLARQFETKANAAIHEATTAREIINDFAGSRLDCFVTGYGTGGTVAGVGQSAAPRAAGDADRPVRAGQRAARRQRHARRSAAADGAPAASHPAFEPHPIQGWTPDFIPNVLQEAIDADLYDEVMPIAGPEGMKWAKALAQKEGIFTGISGGATFAVARQIAETAPAGSVILCMLPDTGERYMTTPLFDGIEAEMDEEEMALSRSTPGCQFPRMTAAIGSDPHGRDAQDYPVRAAEETLDPDDWARCAGPVASDRRGCRRLSARRARAAGLAGDAGRCEGLLRRAPAAIAGAARRRLSRGRRERDALSDGQHPSALLVLVHGVEQFHRRARRFPGGDPGLEPRRRQPRRRADGPARWSTGARK